MSLLKAESYRRGIISSTVFNIGAKGLGFVNSLLIIYLFGSGIKTDLYFVILSTAIVVTSFINGLDLLILIPESMRLRIKSGEAAERKFLNFFVLLYSGIGLFIALVILFAPVFYYSFFTEYDHQLLHSEELMLLVSSILVPLQLLINLFVSILASHKYFTVPMMVGLVNSVVSIAILLLLKNSLSTFGALIAFVAGNIINFIWLCYYLKKHLNWKFFERPPLPSRRIVANIALMHVNILPVSVRSYVITLLLSGLGSGVITSMNYGQLIAFIPEILVVTQIMAVVGIKFNELTAKDEKEELNLFFSNLLKLLFVVVLPVGVIMALTSTEIVSIIFSFTKKVDDISKYNIAIVISFFALTLPARALDMVMTRLLTSQQKIKQGVLYAVVIHTIITLLVFVGIKGWGLEGYLFAIFIGYNILLPAIYYFLLRKIAPFIKYLGWIKSTIPFVLFNGVLIFLLYLAKQKLLSELHPLISIGVIGAVYLLLVLVFNYLSRYYMPLNKIVTKYILLK